MVSHQFTCLNSVLFVNDFYSLVTHLNVEEEYVIGRLLLKRDTGGYFGCFGTSKLC